MSTGSGNSSLRSVFHRPGCEGGWSNDNEIGGSRTKGKCHDLSPTSPIVWRQLETDLNSSTIWEWKSGSRGSSHEGEREGHELTPVMFCDVHETTVALVLGFFHWVRCFVNSGLVRRLHCVCRFSNPYICLSDLICTHRDTPLTPPPRNWAFLRTLTSRFTWNVWFLNDRKPLYLSWDSNYICHGVQSSDTQVLAGWARSSRPFWRRVCFLGKGGHWIFKWSPGQCTKKE
jgi:hypothetical protein